MEAGRSTVGRRPLVVGAALVLALLTACTSPSPTAGTDRATTPATTTPSAPASGPTSSSSPTTGTSTTGTSTTGTAALTVTLPGGARRTWSLAQLLALPRTSVVAADGSTVASVSLPTLTGYDAPPRAGAPDGRLLVVYRVSGTGTPRPMTFTRAESEPSVGNHPALLTLTAAGRLDLVVPQDRTTGRSVLGVDAVAVSTLDVPAAPSPLPAAGAVEVDAGGSRRTVDASALPRLGYALTRPGGPTTQQQGVTLAQVLEAAGVRLDDASLVTVVGSTGGVAALTGGEVGEAQKVVGLSFAQDGRALSRPQLVVGGDVTGARTVASVTRIVVQG